MALHFGKLHEIDLTTYCCPNQQQTNISTGQMLSLQCTEFGYDQAKYISVWRLISRNTEELLTDYLNSNKEGMSVSWFTLRIRLFGKMDWIAAQSSLLEVKVYKTCGNRSTSQVPIVTLLHWLQSEDKSILPDKGHPLTHKVTNHLSVDNPDGHHICHEHDCTFLEFLHLNFGALFDSKEHSLWTSSEPPGQSHLWPQRYAINQGTFQLAIALKRCAVLHVSTSSARS